MTSERVEAVKVSALAAGSITAATCTIALCIASAKPEHIDLEAGLSVLGSFVSGGVLAGACIITVLPLVNAVLAAASAYLIFDFKGPEV